MDFQDWLIVVGVVIVLGILLDGFRRMQLARKDSLKMSRNMMGDIDTSSLDDDYNPELPGGGARVVQKAMDYEASNLSDMSEAQNERVEPTFSSSGLSSGPSSNVSEDSVELEGIEAPTTEMLSANVEDRAVSVSDVPQGVPEPAQEEASSKPKVSRRKSKQESKQAKKQDKVESPEINQDIDQEVIVINVDSKPNTQFSGSDIKQLLEACGLDHGDMSIFHRHEEDDLLSPIQFSVANAVEPGYFDPEKMDAIATPGVSFFMSLPGPKDYMKAFEYMLETAQCFASNLQGELKDERRSVLTPQTIEHCKQRVRDFERKQLSRVRA